MPPPMTMKSCMAGIILCRVPCHPRIATAEQEQGNKGHCRNQVIHQLTVRPKQAQRAHTADQTQQRVQLAFQMTFHKADKGVHAEDTESKNGQYFSPAATDKR